ncbi:hypothetical protein GYH30_049681 [Glycine max]|nr:hypothetical protein GYH30_049681 [Glycine max]
MRRKKRRIIVTKEVLEESFEVEAITSEMEMHEAIDNGLHIFFSGLLLPLYFNQESLEMQICHELILRVLIEYGLDFLRCLLQHQLELPPPAEAHATCLFKHHHLLLHLWWKWIDASAQTPLLEKCAYLAFGTSGYFLAARLTRAKWARGGFDGRRSLTSG